MTTSSGFLEVLLLLVGVLTGCDRWTYIADTPVLPEGFRWFKIELKRSVICDGELEFAVVATGDLL